MDEFNTADELNEIDLKNFIDMTDAIMANSPEDNYTRITQEGYQSIVDAMTGHQEIHVDDDASESHTVYDDPIEYFRWRQHEDEIIGDVFYVESSDKHPVFYFEGSKSGFDDHFFYASVHPENKKMGSTHVKPEVNLNGVSIDEDQNIVYFGSADIASFLE